MPLTTASPRVSSTHRTISCKGFLRDDGLIDVDGCLRDVRSSKVETRYRQVPPGQPAHEMWLRLTIDDKQLIHSVELAMDSAPLSDLPGVVPPIQRLVGVKISGGFKREMRARVGGTAGCTHVVTLLEAMSTVAIQTLAIKRRARSRESMFSTFDSRPGDRPALIDSCYSYAVDSPIVAEEWPIHFRPRSD